MITEEMRDLLEEILIEVKPEFIGVSLDTESRSVTITITGITAQDFEDLADMVDQPTEASHEPE